MAGIPKSTIGRIEAGLTSPKVRNFITTIKSIRYSFCY
ncbi:hypothetical protein [Gracilibacillus sp. YIM 98692]